MTTALSTNMLQLPPVTGLDGSESIWVVQGGTDKRATTGEVTSEAAGIPLTAEFLLLDPNGFLPSSRTLVGASGIVTLTDAGAGSTATISLVAAGVAQLISEPRTVTASGTVTVADDDVAIYMQQAVAEAVDIVLPLGEDKIGPVYVGDILGVCGSFPFRLVVTGGLQTIAGNSELFMSSNNASFYLRPVAGIGYAL